MDNHKEGTLDYAKDQARKLSEKDHNNYFHVHKGEDKYTVSRYYDKDSIECYKNGKLYSKMGN